MSERILGDILDKARTIGEILEEIVKKPAILVNRMMDRMEAEYYSMIMEDVEATTRGREEFGRVMDRRGFGL